MKLIKLQIQLINMNEYLYKLKCELMLKFINFYSIYDIWSYNVFIFSF